MSQPTETPRDEGIEELVRRVSREAAEAERAWREKVAARDAVIVDVLDQGNAGFRAVAEWAKLSRSRVEQILTSAG